MSTDPRTTWRCPPGSPPRAGRTAGACWTRRSARCPTPTPGRRWPRSGRCSAAPSRRSCCPAFWASASTARARPDTERLHHLLSKRGNASFNQGDFAAAVEFYGRALPLAPTAQRRVIMLSVIAKALAEDGRHEQAEETFSQAYALADAEADDV